MAKKKRGGMIPGGMDSALKRAKESPVTKSEAVLRGAKPLEPYASVAPTLNSKRLLDHYGAFRKSVDGRSERKEVATGSFKGGDGVQKAKKSKEKQKEYIGSRIYWIKKNNPSVRGITKNKKGKKK